MVRLHPIAEIEGLKRANQNNNPTTNILPTMKSTLAILALAIFAAVSGSAFAGDFCHSNNYSYNSGYSSHHGGYDSYDSGHGYYEAKCAPVYEPVHCKPYKVSTCEINRCQECRTAYDHCGKPYTYHVTIITYRDTYSDGTYNDYTAQS